MKRIKNTGSIFGNVQRTSYEYMKLLKSKYDIANVLVVDDVDGHHGLSYAKHGSNVVIYESDPVYINGGVIDNFGIIGLNKRVDFEKLDNIEVNNENYYETVIEKKYDFVYCYRSLHRKTNKHISMERKMRKLLSSVKENGYIYIFYHMAKNEKDFNTYSRNEYFRKNEMIKYFDKANWEIINIIEFDKCTNHNKHPYHNSNHTHRIGHIFAKRKNNRLVHKYNYKITSIY